MGRPASKNRIGRTGEKQAAAFLKDQDYQVLEQNFTAGRLEIDLIAYDKQADEIVFVEVKKRTSSSYGHPAQAVDSRKLEKIQAAALAYLARSEFKKPFRFDIISILPDRVEQFKNVSLEL